MTQQEFWQIIGSTGSYQNNLDDQNAVIESRLNGLSHEERKQFGLRYDAMDRLAFRWDLWGAAYQLNGGCSDDGFDYFRGWLISLGQAAFDAALTNPDSLADHLDAGSDSHENEDLLGMAREALGGIDPLPFPPEPEGDDWDFDDEEEMRRRYPRILDAQAPDPHTVQPMTPVFSSLGFRVAQDADSIGRLLEAASMASKAIPSPVGETFVYSGDYHRLWQNFELEESRPVMECGSAPGMLGFVRESLPGGLVKAWMVDRDNPGVAEPYPVCFEAPHFMLGNPPPINDLSSISLTMLADACNLFPSAEALASDPRTLDWPTPEFAATGLFDAAGNELTPPEPKGFLTGTVIFAIRAKNDLCGAEFWALRVNAKFGEIWVCLPMEAIDDDPTGRVIAVAGRLSGSFPEKIPPLDSTPVESDRKNFDNEAVEARIRKLTLDFMQTPEFEAMFLEIHPDKLTQSVAKGIGLFNRQIREAARNLDSHRQLASPALRQRYLEVAQTAPIVFAHIVMANTMALDEGQGSPALVVIAWGDLGMEIMQKARSVLSKVHFDMQEDDRERQLADLIDDEDYHFGRRRPLPDWLVGDQQAYAADLWISSQALDNERLQMEVVVCLAEPGPDGLTIALPGELIQQAIRELDPNAGPPPLPPPPLPGGSSPPPLPPSGGAPS